MGIILKNIKSYKSDKLPDLESVKADQQINPRKL